MLLKGSCFTTVCIRHLKKLLTGVLSVVFLVFGSVAHAQTAPSGAQPINTQNVQTIADQSGVGGTTDIFVIIGNILNITFSFLGVLLLCYFIYAGYLWMTAGGSPEPVEKAKSIMKNAVIGLVIIVSSFAISKFVLDWLGGVNDGLGGPGGGGISRGIGGMAGFPGSAGALGAGLIDYHIPERDAREVPRNASIIISFKQAIDPASVILNYSDVASSTAHDLNTDAIHIFRTGQELSTTLRPADVEAYLTQDHQSLVLRPKALLGSPSANSDYSVRLMAGNRGLRLDSPSHDGASIFGGAGGYLGSEEGYAWRFEVSTLVDNTPPKITSVIPVAIAGGSYAPNIVIQMNFDKPLNPIAASGLLRGGEGFQNVEVAASPIEGTGSSRPDGAFTLSNQFRTIEFVTNVSCGVNSCGRQVFCLPFTSNVAVRVKAATLSEAPPQARIVRGAGSALFDGIVDYTGNSFDGNGDGVAQGPGRGPELDDYDWRFQTTASPNLTAPRVRVVMPAVRSSNVAVDGLVHADFDGMIQTSTLSSDSVKLRTNEPEELRDTMWWTISSALLRADGGVAGDGDRPAASRVSVQHRAFTPSQTTSEGMISPEYAPFYTSDVQNIYQNCFNPGSSIRCTGSPYCCDDRPSATACAFPLPLRPVPITP